MVNSLISMVTRNSYCDWSESSFHHVGNFVNFYLLLHTNQVCKAQAPKSNPLQISVYQSM